MRLAFILSLALAPLAQAAPQSGTHLVVSQMDASVRVIRKGIEIDRFENAAFGLRGVQQKKEIGDDITPRGEYQIIEIRPSSRFNTFISLNYPNIDDANRGLVANRLSTAQWHKINQAHQQRRMPLQNTHLGGHIGIHGLGRGSMKVHRRFNWTQGCIALTNEQINALAHYVKPGTKVVIIP